MTNYNRIEGPADGGETHGTETGIDCVLGVESYSITFDIKSKKRRPYWSGSTVEIPSTWEPYLTVFAAFAACFLTP